MPLEQTLGNISAIVGLVSNVIPAALAAYQTLHAIWQKANPTGTFEQFNAALLADSLDVQATSAAALTAWGYEKDANGNWVKKA